VKSTYFLASIVCSGNATLIVPSLLISSVLRDNVFSPATTVTFSIYLCKSRSEAHVSVNVNPFTLISALPAFTLNLAT
jgi:hypothetical protein